MIKLQLQYKNYAWGSKGSKSLVSRLISKNRGTTVQENEFYAELWAGVHPNGDSEVVLPTGDSKLSEYLRAKSAQKLPYLLKILSVDSILSIQMHPDIENAKNFHKDHPEIYPDDNHKPEMAIALTEFHMLCGFQSPPDFIRMMEFLPSLKSILCEHISENAEYNVIFKKCLKAVFELSKEELHHKFSQIKEEFTKIDCSAPSTIVLHGKLFHDLIKKYPDDPGCLISLLLNYNVLAPGESTFVCAVMPHAYIKGECIEIMSNSDNVVRLGLTPKVKDIESAFKLLDTNRVLHDGYNVKPKVEMYDECKIITYECQVDEFCLKRFQGNNNSCRRNVTISRNSIILNIGEKVMLHFQISPNREDKECSLVEGSAVFVEEDIMLTIFEYEVLDLIVASPKFIK